MSFRDWSAWLKGGVIGLIIGVIGLLLVNINGDIVMVGLLITLGSWGPWSIIVSAFCSSCNSDTAGAIGIWLTPFTYFIYGAILGWLYGKIRNRN